MSDPYCLAMVLCDSVHHDPSTGKKTILGTFSTVVGSEWPTTIDFCIYNEVTDAVGEFVLSFQLVDSAHAFENSEDPIFKLDVPLESPTPLAVVSGTMHAQGVEIAKAGVYHCELLCGDNVLMSRRLVAIDSNNMPER